MSRERKENIRENDAKIKKTARNIEMRKKSNVKTKRKREKTGEEFQK